MTVIIDILVDCFTECLVCSKEDISTKNQAKKKKAQTNKQKRYHGTDFHFLFFRLNSVCYFRCKIKLFKSYSFAERKRNPMGSGVEQV